MSKSDDIGGWNDFEKENSVPVSEAIGYCHIGVDPDYEPVDCYWIPVDDKELSECSHPPRGEIIQYPMEDREPSRVGYDDVPDAVENWDYREEEES